jgi:hypothetical protein
MTISRTWRSLVRLWAVIALFGLTAVPALAHQQGLKDLQDDESPSALEYPGLVGEGEYVSPQFDLEITWSDEWVVGELDDPLVEHANGGYWDGPVASEPDVGDIVFLVDSGTGTAVLSLGFSFLSPTISIDDVVAYIEEPEFLVHNLFLSDDAEILALDASRDSVAVVARDSAPNDNHVIYQMMVLDPEDEDFGFWVGVDMYDPDYYQPIIESVEAGIEVENNEIFNVFDADEVLAAAQADTSRVQEEDSTGNGDGLTSRPAGPSCLHRECLTGIATNLTMYQRAGAPGAWPVQSAAWEHSTRLVPATLPPATPFPAATPTAAVPPIPALLLPGLR